MDTPYYKNEGFVLYQSDAIDLLDSMPGDSVDMIFADPPYFLSTGSFTCQSGKRASVKKGDWDMGRGLDHDFAFHLAWIKACKRVLKPNGTIWISGTYHSIYQCGFALQKNGFHILNDIVWFKPNASPNLSCRFFTASHETLLWAKRDKNAKHTFNYDLIKTRDWEGDFLKKEQSQMRSVWAINTPRPGEKRSGRHPAQKPLELLTRIILSCTGEGDLVLDPFTGSSTTGIAAHLHRRKFIGIDREEDYLALSVRRFEALGSRFRK
jgi:site-specific DNA-methyltransferase (adenine-specific)